MESLLEESNMYVDEDIDSEKSGVIHKRKSKRKKSRVPRFRHYWLTMPEFEEWLMEGVQPELAFCAMCDHSLVATKDKLLRHAASSKHINNCKVDGEDEEERLWNSGIVEDKRESMFPLRKNVISVSNESNVLRVVDMRSDSLSLPPKQMRLAMIKTSTGDTTFDTDWSAIALEKAVAEHLEKEEGLFFPTHVMSNLVALLTHCQARGSTVFAGEDSDICRSNREALVKLGGLNFCSLKEHEDGAFDLDELETLLKTANVDPQLSCVVSYECAHARKGGRVPSLEFINVLGSLQQLYSIYLHCDGTRLVNASVYKDCEPSSLVGCCDSVTFAIDKGYGAPLGAVLVGSAEFIQRASFIRRFLGGHIHQAGIFASAGLFALQKCKIFVETDHEKALMLAKAIISLNSSLVQLNIRNVHTNILLLDCPTKHLNATQLKERFQMVMDTCETVDCEGGPVILLSEVVSPSKLSLMPKGWETLSSQLIQSNGITT